MFATPAPWDLRASSRSGRRAGTSRGGCLSWGLAHRAEGEITEADDAGAKHHQPKQTIFKNAGEAPGCGRWRTHYIDAKRLFLSAAHSARAGLTGNYQH